MPKKPRGQVRTQVGPGPGPHSQPPRQLGGGSWPPLRDAVRRDIEQAANALGFAAALHERLESQRRLFADFPRIMEQLRSGALERVATALARLFEGKEQFDLTRFLRDLPLALAQLAAAEVARKGTPSSPPPPAKESPATVPATAASGESTDAAAATEEAAPEESADAKRDAAAGDEAASTGAAPQVETSQAG